MRSNIFKPLPFLPVNHHLNRWAFGYYLVKRGFSNAIVQEETSFSYKQVRKVRSDLGVNERRGNCYGQDIMSSSDWIMYSMGVHVYCELCEKMTHIEAVVEAYDCLTRKTIAKSYDISGFYAACREISSGEAIFIECRHCYVEVFLGTGLRDKLVSSRCPACGHGDWEHPVSSRRIGHLASAKQVQQALF